MKIMTKNPNRKIFLLATIFIGLALNVILMGNVIRLKTRAATTSAEFIFVPETVSMPPNSSLTLMLDPHGNTISFLRIRLSFDPTYINLIDEVQIENSPLAMTVTKTSRTDANSSGVIEIALALTPGNPAPDYLFEVARLPFTLVSADKNIT